MPHNPNIKIIVFPGSNREKDMADAYERITGQRPELVWHKEEDIGNPDLVILPGGFAHGDYLRCGAMASLSPVMKSVKELGQKGTPIFGVCNGFQTLIEAGLLPGALLRNASLKFICKHVTLSYEASDNALFPLTKGDLIRVPVAHGEGNYFIDPDGLKTLNDNDLVAFRYVENPNGSIDDIAGIMNEQRNILGMMPHPEDSTDPLHETQDGIALFKGILNKLDVAA